MTLTDFLVKKTDLVPEEDNAELMDLLDQLDNELRGHELPRWAYTNSEWFKHELRRIKLQNKIAKIRLSGV